MRAMELFRGSSCCRRSSRAPPLTLPPTGFMLFVSIELRDTEIVAASPLQPCNLSTGSGKTRKTYLARVRGDFGLKLPAGSRQEGSPNTAEAGTDAPLLSGGVTSSDEGGSAASTAMGTDSTTLPVSSASGELSKEPDKAGELWWRYEPPGKGVVQDPARRDSGVVAAENPDEEAVEDSTAGSSTMDGKGCPSRGDSCGEVGGVTVRVNCPISVVDPKDGVYGCIPGGKEAQTVSALQGTGLWWVGRWWVGG